MVLMITWCVKNVIFSFRIGIVWINLLRYHTVKSYPSGILDGVVSIKRNIHVSYWYRVDQHGVISHYVVLYLSIIYRTLI